MALAQKLFRVSFVLAFIPLAVSQGHLEEMNPVHKPEYVKSPLPHTYTTPDDLPTEFTWQNVSGVSWLTPAMNQHIPVYCGSCWLHAATTVMNDRLKIARKGIGPDFMLARQVVLNCGTEAGTCKGGSMSGVFEWVRRNGIPDETCQQYDATDHECSDLRTCMNCDPAKSLQPGEDMCYPVQRYGKHFVEEWGPVETVDGVTPPHNLKAEIFRRGPVACGIDAGRLERGHYKPGELISDTENLDGTPFRIDHDITVVGWGVENGVEYWHVQNSWGRYWGEDGFFRVRTGVNSLLIEKRCFWVVVGSEPVVQDYGPSDANRVFPSGDAGLNVIV